MVAVQKGTDVDQPRNLAKSVTVGVIKKLENGICSRRKLFFHHYKPLREYFFMNK